MTNTPVVDLNRSSSDAVAAMGPVAANRLAQLPPPAAPQDAAWAGATIPAPRTEVQVQPGDTGTPRWGDPKLAFDYTHLGREGAEVFARLVVEDLARVMPQLQPLLIP